MTLPGNLTTITVTGTVLDPAGNPVAGSVTFEVPSLIKDSAGSAIFPLVPYTATLTGGSFSVVLPCTDNAGFSPTGWGYTVTVTLANGTGYTYNNIAIPQSLGTTVDISALLPTTTTATAVANPSPFIGSGFPLRAVTPQISVFSRKEQAHTFTQSNGSFAKSSIVCEHWAGATSENFVLRRLWTALQSGGNYPGIVEDQGTWNFWIDNDGTDGSGPTFSLSSAELYGWIYSGGVPQFSGSAIRMGRTSKGAYNSSSTYTGGGQRALWTPAQRYLRVELTNNTSSSDESILYNGSHVDSVPTLPSNQQRFFKIFSPSAAGTDITQTARAPLTIVDTSVSGPHGPGQLESVMVAFNPTGSDAVLEGNVQIFTDNGDGLGYQLYYESTGGEDFFLGSWGIMNPGYPVVQSVGPGNAMCLTRFFNDDPIFFAKDIKIVWWVGQPSEGSWADATVPVRANAGIWFDNNPQSIKYWAPDLTNQLFFDDFNYAAGALDTTKFGLNTTGTLFTASGSSTAVINDITATDRVLTILPAYYTPPANYWVEARVQQGSYTAGTQSELALSGIAATSAKIANAGAVEFYQDSSNNTFTWMKGREAFSIAAHESIGTAPSAGYGGVWFRLAMKVIGAGSANPTCYGYWRFDDPSRTDNYWHPIGRWTHTANNGGLIGFWAWQPSHAAIDWIRVYALRQYTS